MVSEPKAAEEVDTELEVEAVKSLGEDKYSAALPR